MRYYGGLAHFNTFKHALLCIRDKKVKDYFPTSLAARVPNVIGPNNQRHSLETFTQNQITWGEKQDMKSPFWLTQQRWCGAAAGSYPQLPNPAGGFLIWQAASRLFQKQQLLWQPTLVIQFLDAQPPKDSFSPSGDSLRYP